MNNQSSARVEFKVTLRKEGDITVFIPNTSLKHLTGVDFSICGNRKENGYAEGKTCFFCNHSQGLFWAYFHKKENRLYCNHWCAKFGRSIQRSLSKCSKCNCEWLACILIVANAPSQSSDEQVLSIQVNKLPTLSCFFFFLFETNKKTKNKKKNRMKKMKKKKKLEKMKKMKKKLENMKKKLEKRKKKLENMKKKLEKRKKKLENMKKKLEKRKKKLEEMKK
jgi:hypothetical protein